MSAQIIPLVKPPVKEIEQRCSFCNRPKEKVKALIESSVTDKCICNICINIASQRLKE